MTSVEEISEKEEKGEYVSNPPELEGAPDMSMLIYLDEVHVLHNLRVRYAKDEIYTSIANILVAINPYKTLQIYGKDLISKYSGLKQSLHFKLPPHIYAISEASYSNLLSNHCNQSMIVCGESGSGKTENAKFLMRHLAFATSGTVDDNEGLNTPDNIIIEQQVLAANPILESFGNAKTNLNNNSSRFGKFTKVLFEKGKIVGSYIETYLLEKSRVTKQDSGERNFHIFYQIIRGLSPKIKETFWLEDPRKYYYLNQGNAVEIDGVSDHGRFEELRSALNTLRFSEKDQEEVFRCVAGILHIGNCNFVPKEEGVCVKDEKHLAKAAELFGVPKQKLESRLTTRNIRVMKQVIPKGLGIDEAVSNRDAIGKALFNALFKEVVRRINMELYSAPDESKGVDISHLLWIGILDVFGFESFDRNSFEQFCINFANERLQEYFNFHVIRSEQEEYKREGVFWVPIEVPDNSKMMDLVDSKPNGLFALLDSACIMPSGSDETFTSVLFSQNTKNKLLRRVMNVKQKGGVKGGRLRKINGFALKHYAGEVIYEAESFLVKNTDSADDDTVDLFCSSEYSIIESLLRSEDASHQKGRIVKKRFRSVGTVFSRQLAVLMKQLESTKPFFVRCVNPNRLKKPNAFIGEHVLSQLRCGGLVEALRVLKLGYPTRCPYAQIKQRYSHILGERGLRVHERDFCEAVLFAFDLCREDYQLGITKVFFKPNKAEMMERILKQAELGIPIETQQKIRKYLIKKRMMRMCGAVKAHCRFTVRLQRLRALRLLQKTSSLLSLLQRGLLRVAHRSRRDLAIRTIQCFVRAYQCGRRLKNWIRKKDAGLVIWFAFKHSQRRKALVRALNHRIAKKKSEAERIRLESEQKEMDMKRKIEEENEHKMRAEREERLKKGVYEPSAAVKTPKTVLLLYEKYDNEMNILRGLTEEIGQWIAHLNKRSIEEDLFEALRDGKLLCQLALSIDVVGGDGTNVKFRPNGKARKGNYFARENAKKFLNWIRNHLGIHSDHIVDVNVVMNPFEELEEDVNTDSNSPLFETITFPQRILNMLLNVMFVAGREYGLDVSETIEKEIKWAAKRKQYAKEAERNGLFFFNNKGQFILPSQAAKEKEEKEEEEMKRKEEEEKKRKEEEEKQRKLKEIKEKEEYERKLKEELEEKNRLQEEAERKKLLEEVEPPESREEKLNENLLPEPDINPHKAKDSNANENFFLMTTAAVLRRLEEEGVLNPKEWKDFDSRGMFKIACREKIPWHQWYDWVKDRVLASLYVAAVASNKQKLNPIKALSVLSPEQAKNNKNSSRKGSDRKLRSSSSKKRLSVQSENLNVFEEDSSSFRASEELSSGELESARSDMSFKSDASTRRKQSLAEENVRLREELLKQSKILEKAMAQLKAGSSPQNISSIESNVHSVEEKTGFEKEVERRSSILFEPSLDDDMDIDEINFHNQKGRKRSLSFQNFGSNADSLTFNHFKSKSKTNSNNNNKNNKNKNNDNEALKLSSPKFKAAKPPPGPRPAHARRASLQNIYKFSQATQGTRQQRFNTALNDEGGNHDGKRKSFLKTMKTEPHLGRHGNSNSNNNEKTKEEEDGCLIS